MATLEENIDRIKRRLASLRLPWRPFTSEEIARVRQIAGPSFVPPGTALLVMDPENTPVEMGIGTLGVACRELIAHCSPALAETIVGLPTDTAWLVEELEAALGAIHDLRAESTAYRRGKEEGVEEGIRLGLAQAGGLVRKQVETSLLGEEGMRTPADTLRAIVRVLGEGNHG